MCSEQEQKKVLTAVSDCKAVGHLQVIYVRSQSEIRHPELNHPDSERTVLLICTPREQATYDTHTHTDEKTVRQRAE